MICHERKDYTIVHTIRNFQLYSNDLETIKEVSFFKKINAINTCQKR